LNCDGVARSVSSYIDGELDAPVKHEFEVHVGECWECKVLVEQTKHTVRIFLDCDLVDFPSEVKTRLRERLRREIEKRPNPRG
jgi:anti-sigma factor RsiW